MSVKLYLAIVLYVNWVFSYRLMIELLLLLNCHITVIKDSKNCTITVKFPKKMTNKRMRKIYKGCVMTCTYTHCRRNAYIVMNSISCLVLHHWPFVCNLLLNYEKDLLMNCRTTEVSYWSCCCFIMHTFIRSIFYSFRL